MRRGNTDRRRTEKRSAALGLLLFALLQLACAVAFGALCWIPDMPRWLGVLFAALAAFCLALLLPAAWALKKRFQEIDAVGPVVTIKEERDMLLVNIEYIPGKEIEVLGMAKGTVVQSKNFGKDFMAGMKTLVGGEIKSYTDMLNEARATATARMVEEAQALGADAVINLRYASSAVMQGAAEVIAYGTAVRYRD